VSGTDGSVCAVGAVQAAQRKHRGPQLFYLHLHLFFEHGRWLVQHTRWPANTPQGMAQRFDVPYLGKLPMDPNMMRACEEGKSFLEAYPGSVAAAPFAAVVQQIVQMTPDV